MGAFQKPRNVRIRGQRTSMRLEASFWDALEEIAEARDKTLEEICDGIAKRLHRGNLSSAIRVYVLDWWRKQPRRNAGRTLADKLGRRETGAAAKRLRTKIARKKIARPKKKRAKKRRG